MNIKHVCRSQALPLSPSRHMSWHIWWRAGPNGLDAVAQQLVSEPVAIVSAATPAHLQSQRQTVSEPHLLPPLAGSSPYCHLKQTSQARNRHAKLGAVSLPDASHHVKVEHRRLLGCKAQQPHALRPTHVRYLPKQSQCLSAPVPG